MTDEPYIPTKASTGVFAQYVITYFSVRSEPFQGLVKGEPTLLYHGKRLLKERVRRERVSEEEVRAAVRSSGFLSLDEVAAVVLETDGSFSVVGSSDTKTNSALANVAVPERTA